MKKKTLIQQMNENYNDANLEDVEKHIEEESKKPAKPVYRMVVEHKGPTKVTVTDKSMKSLAKTLLK